MKSFILALRAVGAALAMRLYVPAATGVGIVMALLVGGGLWLTTLSKWWWLLFVPITTLFCIVLGVAFVVFSLIRYVRPAQTKVQKQAVGKLADKLQGVAEVVGTPKVFILFRVVRSIAAPSKDTYLKGLVARRDIATDFKKLQESFDT